MRCRRCDGMMVRDTIFDPFGTEYHSKVWRCIGCGEILDPVILANRRRSRSQLAGGKLVGEFFEVKAA